MDKYATVNFNRNEREQQRDFLLAMNGAEIIQISREDVENWYKEDTMLNTGCDNHIVLHDDEEVNRFKYVMQTFFGNKEYKITEEPESEEFKRWIERKKEMQ